MSRNNKVRRTASDPDPDSTLRFDDDDDGKSKSWVKEMPSYRGF
jgi:hypothetical protein